MGIGQYSGMGCGWVQNILPCHALNARETAIETWVGGILAVVGAFVFLVACACFRLLKLTDV